MSFALKLVSLLLREGVLEHFLNRMHASTNRLVFKCIRPPASRFPTCGPHSLTILGST